MCQWTAAFHVAVDRWTGGAAESLLYTVLEPHGVAWEPIRVTLDLMRLPSEKRLPSLILLLLVVRDMAQGRVPLGFAVNRGMGAVAVDRVLFSGRDLEGDLQSLIRLELPNGDLAGLSANARTRFQEAWNDWLKLNRKAEL